MKKALLSLILALAMLLGTVTVFAADTGFVDVKESRWSYDNITWAVENGYMNGVGDGRFNPAGTTTRAMVETVLYRLAGSPDTDYVGLFNDVQDGKWFTDAVVWAAQKEIVNGVGNAKFAPNANVTREQLAAIFYRYADFDNVKTGGVKADLSVYKDVKKVSSYAKDAMAWANKVGLVNGVTSDTLNPKGNATREQFAAILNRYATYEDFDYKLVYNTPVVRSTFTEKPFAPIPDDAIIVSPDGNDSNPGTADKPIKTFAKAVSLVRERKKTATDEIVVAFKAGHYGALDNLTLTQEDKGSADVPVRYTRYGDGEVVFDNGVSLYGKDFKALTDAEKALFPAKEADKIKKLSLGKVFPDGMPDGLKIFGGDAPIWEARYPNKSNGKDIYMKYMLSVPTEEDNYYGMDVLIRSPLSLALKKFGDLNGAKLVGYIMYGWRVDTFYIDSYDTTTNQMKLDKNRLPSDFYTGSAGGGIRTPQMPMDDVYVSGKSLMLDDEGEYWYDDESNTIYVYDPAEEYTVGIDGTFLTLDDADNVTLEGLTFVNNTASAINVNNSENVTVDGVKMSGVGACITLSGASDRFTVKNSEFMRFSDKAITVNVTMHRTTLESNRIVIDNNCFHDYGDSTVFANQAIKDSAIGTLISHNEFRNSPNGAVGLGMLSTVEYNVFDNMMTCTQDYGIIYTYEAMSSSRQNHIRYNLFMNMKSGATYGNYIDDFSQDQYIYGNVFYNCGACGVMLHNARNCFVHDNFFYGCNLQLNGFGFVSEETGKVFDDAVLDSMSWGDIYRKYYGRRINEGEEGYEVWKAQFPSLYEFEPDKEHPESYYSFFCPWNSIHHNLLVNANENITGTFAEEWGDIHDNVKLEETGNPYFTDPTHGDYTLKDGVTFFSIPFEKIGRY